MLRLDGLADHLVLIAANIGSAGFAKVEDACHVTLWPRTFEVTRNQTANIFSEGDTQLARAPLGEALRFGFEADLVPS